MNRDFFFGFWTETIGLKFTRMFVFDLKIKIIHVIRPQMLWHLVACSAYSVSQFNDHKHVACVFTSLYVDEVREVPSVDQAVIDLVAGARVWRVSGFEVHSFMHEVRALDHHLSASSKVYQSDSVFVCTIKLAVSPKIR
jgi:hypothetical protein